MTINRPLNVLNPKIRRFSSFEGFEADLLTVAVASWKLMAFLQNSWLKPNWCNCMHLPASNVRAGCVPLRSLHSPRQNVLC
eukprot:scaffold6661_cov122-Skeletonema_marinoi.AAC.12